MMHAPPTPDPLRAIDCMVTAMRQAGWVPTPQALTALREEVARALQPDAPEPPKSGDNPS